MSDTTPDGAMHGGFGGVNPTEAQLAAVQAADPDYLAGSVHRTAGLERTTILATTPVIDASKPG